MATLPILRVVEREVRVFRRLWRGIVFSSFLNPVLYLAAMGIGLGDLVDANSGGTDGLEYIVFVAPGLLAASAIQVAAGESLWPVMAGVKWIQTSHAMVATPLRPRDVFGGFVLWGALRTVLSSAAFLVVAALLGAIPSAWAPFAVPAAALCAAAVSAPLAAFAATQDTDLTFPVIMRLGVLPMFLFSGAFFPVDQLPGAVQAIAKVSPLWHGVELCRAAATGSATALAVVAHVVVLLAFAAAGWAWGTRTFARRLAA